MLAASALLPDALVGLVPVLADPFDHAGEVDPRLVVDRRAVAAVVVDGVDQLAVDVELELVRGAVPDPDGRGALIALEVLEHLLLELRAAIDPVHDLERAVALRPVLAEALAQPLPERRGLFGEAQPQERVERERGVADPGVAVVPVATAAELLGEARGGRGHDPARGPEGEQLERERRAVHHLAPAALVAGLGQPLAPVLERPVQRVARLVLRVGPRHVVLRHPLEHEGHAVARGQCDLAATRRPRRGSAAWPSRAPARSPPSGTPRRSRGTRSCAGRARS